MIGVNLHLHLFLAVILVLVLMCAYSWQWLLFEFTNFTNAYWDTWWFWIYMHQSKYMTVSPLFKIFWSYIYACTYDVWRLWSGICSDHDQDSCMILPCSKSSWPLITLAEVTNLQTLLSWMKAIVYTIASGWVHSWQCSHIITQL